MKTNLKHQLLLSLLFACSALSGRFQAFAEDHEHHHHETSLATPDPATVSTDSVFNITDSWTAADGKTFQLGQLGGKPTVVAMVYTSCQYVCPLTVQNIKRIERALPAAQAGKVNFALFSFDPQRDTPAKLAEFAKLHAITSPSWVLAQGSESAVRKLAVTLGIKYKKVQSGDYEHDATISILDSKGVVRFQSNAMNKDIHDATEALKALLH
ncbi:SCO family protein [Methylotenera sp. G11]|uniref:SCO family protein n=1 Tax=Methylotenera sp. G11 TaxID=1506585 RepID=UPI000645C5A1|nr:SCO family protein [Methylotenera sp. G11]